MTFYANFTIFTASFMIFYYLKERVLTTSLTMCSHGQAWPPLPFSEVAGKSFDQRDLVSVLASNKFYFQITFQIVFVLHLQQNPGT